MLLPRHLVLLLAGVSGPALAEPARGYVDLHVHLAAHLTVPVYGAGPEAKPPAGLTNRHGLSAHLFASQLEAPGPSLLVSLAYANPFATVFETKVSMWARLERQLAYVEAFVSRHSARFGFARTPEEARAIITSGRTAVVHGLEGATLVLDSPEDAARWAARGVAVITPVHLADNELGGAWCQGGDLAILNLPGCQRERRDPMQHGLTAAGKARLHDLVDVGIIIDMAHLSDASFSEAAAILRERSAAPVYTHVTADAVRPDPTALTDAQLREIAALGGLAGVTANQMHLPPLSAAALPADHCRGSVDDFALHWAHIVSVTGGAPLGWGSDFQGGVAHIGPKYGPRGCAAAPAGRAANAFDLSGLAHAGMVQPMFDALAAAGADLAPLLSSTEQFLTVWERDRRLRR